VLVPVWVFNQTIATVTEVVGVFVRFRAPLHTFCCPSWVPLYAVMRGIDSSFYARSFLFYGNTPLGRGTKFII
jgi:hypothetical protein